MKNLFKSVITDEEFNKILWIFEYFINRKRNFGLGFELNSLMAKDVKTTIFFYFQKELLIIKFGNYKDPQETYSEIFAATITDKNHKEVAYNILKRLKEFDNEVASSKNFLYDKIALYCNYNGIFDKTTRKYFG